MFFLEHECILALCVCLGRGRHIALVHSLALWSFPMHIPVVVFDQTSAVFTCADQWTSFS